MAHPKLTLLTLPLVFAFSAVLIITPSKSQEQKESAKRRKVFDETKFPIANYQAPEPTDPAQRAKRQARGKKYDNSDWRVHPNSVSDSNVRVDYVDRNLPALPFDKSSIVVVGQVMNAEAFLSNDRTGIYSVFTVQVNEILKKPSNSPITTTSSIEVERDGGRVRFPNGRLHLYKIGGQDMLRVGSRYALFLSAKDETNLEILTGYEFVDGKVYPLDDLPNLYTYEDVDEATFVRELRARTSN